MFVIFLSIFISSCFSFVACFPTCEQQRGWFLRTHNFRKVKLNSVNILSALRPKSVPNCKYNTLIYLETRQNITGTATVQSTYAVLKEA